MIDLSELKTGLTSISPHGGTLVERQLKDEELNAERQRARNLLQVPLSPINISDVEMIGVGAYSPLSGFMGRTDYRRVVKEMRLANGLVWPMPITLPIDDDLADKIEAGQEIALVQQDRILAIMKVSEKFRYDKEQEARQVYQTTETKHPGVARLYQQGNTLLGGDIWLLNLPEPQLFPELCYTPAQTRNKFVENDWHQVVGFQTRNPIHRAHEYILNHALEIVDGLFLHPLVGETKSDDFPAEARIKSYQALLSNYYPATRVFLGVFPAAMRYAGPREAVFHALCRKNYGCTHFIVGNDHAGVGNYYAPTAACDIFKEFDPEEIGIEILCYPDTKYYCRKCGGVVTPKTCPHDQNCSRLSGSQIREILVKRKMPPKEVMRPEVSGVLMTAIRGRRSVRYSISRAIDILINDHDPKGLILRSNAMLRGWGYTLLEKLRLLKTS